MGNRGQKIGLSRLQRGWASLSNELVIHAPSCSQRGLIDLQTQKHEETVFFHTSLFITRHWKIRSLRVSRYPCQPMTWCILGSFTLLYVFVVTLGQYLMFNFAFRKWPWCNFLSAFLPFFQFLIVSLVLGTHVDTGDTKPIKIYIGKAR